MTFEYRILPVRNDLRSSEGREGAFFRSRKKPANRSGKNRRDLKEDRRKSFRDGVIVTLSVLNDPRTGKDPKQNTYSRYGKKDPRVVPQNTGAESEKNE